MVEKTILGLMALSTTVLAIVTEPGLHKEVLVISAAIYIAAGMIVSAIRREE